MEGEYQVGQLTSLLGGQSKKKTEEKKGGLFSKGLNERPLLSKKRRRPAADKEEAKEGAGGEDGKDKRRKKQEPKGGPKGKAERKVDDPEKLARTLFVGSVPLSAASNLEKLKKVIKRTFSAFGAVQSVRLRSIPVSKTAVPAGANYKTMIKVSAVQNNLSEAGRTCNAYVVYEEKAGVEAALQQRGVLELDGMHLRVDKMSGTDAKSRAKTDKSLFDRRRSIFVGNLSPQTTEESLREYFDNAKGLEVEDVRVVRDRMTALCKGFGYVLFRESDMVDVALQLHEEVFLNRPMRVNRCQKSNSLKRGADSGSHQGSKATYLNGAAARSRLRSKGKSTTAKPKGKGKGKGKPQGKKSGDKKKK